MTPNTAGELEMVREELREARAPLARWGAVDYGTPESEDILHDAAEALVRAVAVLTRVVEGLVQNGAAVRVADTVAIWTAGETIDLVSLAAEAVRIETTGGAGA